MVQRSTPFFSGLGVELASRMTVKSVRHDSAGAQCGLRRGDRLVSLNGVSTAHLSLVDIVSMMRNREEAIIRVARPSEKRNVEEENAYETLEPAERASYPRRAYSPQSTSKLRRRVSQWCDLHRLMKTNSFLSLHDLDRNAVSVCETCSTTQRMTDCK